MQRLTLQQDVVGNINYIINGRTQLLVIAVATNGRWANFDLVAVCQCRRGKLGVRRFFGAKSFSQLE